MNELLIPWVILCYFQHIIIQVEYITLGICMTMQSGESAIRCLCLLLCTRSTGCYEKVAVEPIMMLNRPLITGLSDLHSLFYQYSDRLLTIIK